MTCPNCGSHNAYVMDTLPGFGTEIYRRKMCRDCNSRFRTVEVVDDGSSEFDKGYRDALYKKTSFNKKSRGDK